MRVTEQERFWSQVDKETDAACGGRGCWLWIGYTDCRGYGWVRFGGKNRRAHRVALELAGRSVVAPMVTDHLCRLRCCVNPEHLEVVTSKENILRGISFAAVNASKSACPKCGGEYIPRRGGRRRCVPCNTRSGAAWDVAHRESVRQSRALRRDEINARRRKAYAVGRKALALNAATGTNTNTGEMTRTVEPQGSATGENPGGRKPSPPPIPPASDGGVCKECDGNGWLVAPRQVDCGPCHGTGREAR